MGSDTPRTHPLASRYAATWENAWSRLGAASADPGLLADLMRRHAEPHRRYHTLQHIDECFANFALLRGARDNLQRSIDRLGLPTP